MRSRPATDDQLPAANETLPASNFSCKHHDLRQGTKTPSQALVERPQVVAAGRPNNTEDPDRGRTR